MGFLAAIIEFLAFAIWNKVRPYVLRAVAGFYVCVTLMLLVCPTSRHLLLSMHGRVVSFPELNLRPVGHDEFRNGSLKCRHYCTSVPVCQGDDEQFAYETVLLDITSVYSLINLYAAIVLLPIGFGSRLRVAETFMRGVCAFASLCFLPPMSDDIETVLVKNPLMSFEQKMAVLCLFTLRVVTCYEIILRKFKNKITIVGLCLRFLRLVLQLLLLISTFSRGLAIPVVVAEGIFIICFTVLKAMEKFCGCFIRFSMTIICVCLVLFDLLAFTLLAGYGDFDRLDVACMGVLLLMRILVITDVSIFVSNTLNVQGPMKTPAALPLRPRPYGIRIVYGTDLQKASKLR